MVKIIPREKNTTIDSNPIQAPNPAEQVNDRAPLDDPKPVKESKPKDEPVPIDESISTDEFKSIEDLKSIKVGTPNNNQHFISDHKPVEEKKKKKKNKNKKKKPDKPSELVFVEIKKSRKNSVKCVKKDVQEEDLKYIAVSYRWGDLDEQLVQTPDYPAYVSSFHILDLIHLCRLIKQDPDLKDIQYLWIDAISVNQHDPSRKKDALLRMQDIFRNATYILAVPDLHYRHLMKNPLNDEVLDLIWKHNEVIYEDILYSVTNLFHNLDHLISNPTQHTNNQLYPVFQKLKNSSIIKENDEIRKAVKKLEKEMKVIESNKAKDEIIKSYQFLAHLIDDWSNRTWVISEYFIAKEKYEEDGTPLKYLFLSLWTNNGSLEFRPFFSHDFTDLRSNKEEDKKKAPALKNRIEDYEDVVNGRELINYLESKFTKRTHLDMMLKSNADKNEDRFYAILPSWKKYQHLIKNKNTVADWNITNSLSLRLKLYEMFEADDLWNKARLLYSSSYYLGRPALPSFATNYQSHLVCIEVDDTDFTSSLHIDYLLRFKVNIDGNHFKNAKEYITEYVMKSGSIFKQNLIDIKYHPPTEEQQCHLSIRVKKYFSFELPPISTLLSDESLMEYSFLESEHLELIYIPYFTYDIPLFDQLFPTNKKSHPILSGTLLFGDMRKNRWILMGICTVETLDTPKLCSLENARNFNIY